MASRGQNSKAGLSSGRPRYRPSEIRFKPTMSCISTQLKQCGHQRLAQTSSLSLPTMSSPETVPPASEADAHTRHLQRHAARQQIATPLSLLVFIVAATLAQTVANPSMKEISDTYLTVLTPTSTTVAGYWCLLLILLVGQ